MTLYVLIWGGELPKRADNVEVFTDLEDAWRSAGPYIAYEDGDLDRLQEYRDELELKDIVLRDEWTLVRKVL